MLVQIAVARNDVPEVARAKLHPAKQRRAVRLYTEHVQAIMQYLPIHIPRPQAQHWTPRQRRAFFYKLKSGEIMVPYLRWAAPNSERLTTQWVVFSPEWNTYTLRNDASYADLVHGFRQTEYHRITGHKLLAQVGRDEAGVLESLAIAEINRDEVLE